MALVLIPVLVIGLILGIIELIFVHSDESGMGWMKHGIHAIPTMIIFIFISMNLSFVYGLIGWEPSLLYEILIRSVIGILAMFKIAGAAAVAGRVGEKMWHVIIIGVLVMVAPFIWELLICNMSWADSIPMNGCPAKAIVKP